MMVNVKEVIFYKLMVRELGNFHAQTTWVPQEHLNGYLIKVLQALGGIIMTKRLSLQFLEKAKIYID